ncbi:MAG: shikimate kinase AroK [Gammaproteobacteria bacterium]|nr:shikimate kinase AroK [Gammaproteobacteria bacterium]
MTTKGNLYLIGPMGSGKTAVGRELARVLGKRFYDSDAEIERRTGVDIPFIFQKEGEQRFREREADVIAELTGLADVVVATGGGAVLSPANRERLSTTGTVVYLRASVAEQLNRTRLTRNRPLLETEDPRAVLEGLAAAREPLYQEIADLCVDTTNRQVRHVVTAIRQLLESRSRRGGVQPLQN